MSGVVPYLIRAYCDWIEDSGLTPHVLVNCEKKGAIVPEGLAKEGKIVLNISSSATVGRAITNDSISFKADLTVSRSRLLFLSMRFLLFMHKRMAKACSLINQKVPPHKRQKNRI